MPTPASASAALRQALCWLRQRQRAQRQLSQGAQVLREVAQHLTEAAHEKRKDTDNFLVTQI
jgi:hypothetical protein